MPLFGKKKQSSSSQQQALVVRDDNAPAQQDAASLKAESDARAQMEAEDLSEMLSLRKPKNMIDGTASGLKLMVGGVVGGAVGLVAMPAIEAAQGARANGAKGAAKGLASGLAKGVAGAVVLPLAGAAGGTSQIVRGVAQTPYAVSGAYNGKQWDKDERVWRFYSLPDEETSVKEAEEDWTKKLAARREALRGGKSGGGVEDTSFYELIGVAPDATQNEIKRAYMKLAMKMHPDKNRDDPDATEKFQKLSTAYQVLSNEDSRARYDTKGMEGLGDQNFMDPSTMYVMLFGSEKFGDLIGELQIAAMLQQAEGGDGMDPSYKHLTHKQRQREVTCARKLADRLQPYVDYAISEEAFVDECKAHAAELAQTAFGELLTHTIGNIYVFKASQALKVKLGEKFSEKWKMKTHTWGANAKALKAMVRMYKVSKEAAGLKDESEQAKAMQKDFATFLEGAWYVSVVDVESTLRHVCKKVLTDTSLGREGRKRRAHALRCMGSVFLEAASEETKNADGTKKTLRERLQELMPQDPGGGEASASANPEDGDDDDDFADLDEPTPRPGGGGGASSSEGGGGAVPGYRDAAGADAHPSGGGSGFEADVPVGPPSREVLLAMSVRELKSVMVAQGLSHEGLLEKTEFVDAIIAASELASTGNTHV